MKLSRIEFSFRETNVYFYSEKLQIFDLYRIFIQDI